MQKSGSRKQSPFIKKLALAISHILTPPLLATLLLLLSPLRSLNISWPEAFIAAFFTTVLPWIILALAKFRGTVSDMHVTRREQRHWLYAVTAALILGGVVTLLLMQASGEIFLEVLSIFCGLLVVSLINLWWKVSVHLAVGVYAALHLFAADVSAMPAVMAFIAILTWARVRSNQHTASQACGGVLVGIAIYYVSEILGFLILGS